MSKKKISKIERKSEFRYNNETNHPNYIFAKKGNKYKSFGLTHNEKTFGKKNMPLDKNPNPNDNKQAYIRNGIISSKVNNYDKNTLDNYSFSNTDKPKIKSKIRNYFNKLRKRKNK